MILVVGIYAVPTEEVVLDVVMVAYSAEDPVTNSEGVEIQMDTQVVDID